MYFSRIILSQSAVDERAFWTQAGSEYRIHQGLWRLFDDGADRPRDFLFREERFDGRLGFYLVSHRPPLDREGLWDIHPPQVYEPQLRAGDRLRFSVRVEPVISRRKVRETDGRNIVVRHDVIMDARQREKESGGVVTPRVVMEHEAGVTWLEARAARHGFGLEPDSLLTEGYQQHVFKKKGANSAVRYSTLDFHGVLVVTDPDAFCRVLFQGLGPGKSFGCGLLLVRRA